MDANEENEQIISSDEYSDEDDDAIMNDAIRAQNQEVKLSDYRNHDKQLNWRIDQKRKELSSLIRRNKISIIYKKKSIKWLNNKRKRDRYKKLINQNSRNFNINPVECPAVASLREKQCLSDNQNNDAINIEDFYLKSNKEINNIHQNTLSTFINCTNQDVNTQAENVQLGVAEKNVHGDENMEDIQKIEESAEKVENPRKRSRSKSSSLSNQSKECPQFDSGINNMFPKFNKMATHHVDYITNRCLKTLDEKMANLSTEIDVLNEVLHAKENELNRLSYLKMVKEEIYFRLSRKRHTLQQKESFSDKQHQYTLLELKEFEICLSDKKKHPSESFSSDTIQKLIENRASMSAKDLEREKNNTSRLHSLLVSQNMLHATELIDNTCFVRNVKKMNIGLPNKNCEKNEDPDEDRIIKSKGPQGQERNFNSLIADFKEINSELLPHIANRIKPTESNGQQVISIPLFEKISRSQLFNKDNKCKFSPNSVNEISITPIRRQKKLSSCLQSVRLDNNFSKNKGTSNGKSPKSVQYPFCQECKTKESRFVCAGCGNQWYCSKNCQITAWDTHSDLCTE